jgi:cyanophycinase
VDHGFTHEVASQGNCIDWEFGAAEAADSQTMARRFHGHRIYAGLQIAYTAALDMPQARISGIFIAALICVAALFSTAHSHAQQTTGIELFSLPAATPGNSQAPSFGVALLGGGGDVDDAAKFLCDHSHGGEIVVLRASGRDAYNPYFHQLCPGNSITTLLITSAEGAKAPDAIQHVRNAHALFIAGGDQSNYVKMWPGPLLKEINDAIARGVPIGGTSAGLAVLGEFAFSARNDTVTSAEALANPFDPKVTLERDFLSIPVMQGIITDSHFSPRQRLGRTVAFLARIEQDDWAKHARAIGIDEATAVLVDPDGKAIVAGKGSAYFLELSHQPVECAPGKPLTVRGLKAYKLGTGAESKFDLKSWIGTGGLTFNIDVENGTMSLRQIIF